ncbi:MULTISPECIES: protein translocase subunit SecF [unclassified Roseateles]|uniref:protein translocase subunit SecF n=1 Tax=unclassified Roseateles TaxID=2626991 RepID=UPI0006F7F0FB|nr:MULTISPECIES: protein translocase subunit SecF [unclassified Roseateles]KQW51285.1 preprotein translocase subunit SecF [Pelomonas sp. Root405]KRA77517.1 preprotein translocase subunit SecF [Pelomonas sp. Root662]
MELFRIKRDLPLMKHALIFNAISFITFAAAVFFLVTRGLHFSIEFTGGTVIEVAYAQAAEVEKTRHTVEQMGYGEVQVQNFGSSRDVMIRLPIRPGEKQTEVVDKVFSQLCKAEVGTVTHHNQITPQGEQVDKQICAKADGAEPIKLSRSEVVGPAVGAELAQDAAKALAVTVIGIMIYLAIRFEWKFAVAGIIANLHDVIIILGFFAFFQWEFSLAVLAAILAVLGYSVNESVVIFDRVREAFRKFRKMNTHEVIDHAITSTMSRTIITHGSTQLMVVSMLLFGGPTLHYFAVALTIGILFGIYSSVFVAAAIAMWLGVKREDLVKVAVNRDDPSDPNSGAVV